MANRVMQAKVFKMKRRGRHRKWGVLAINSGHSPDLTKQIRPKPPKVPNEYLEGLFPGVHSVSEPRRLAQRTRNLLLHAKEDKFFVQVLENTGATKYEIHINTKMDHFYFVKHDLVLKLVWKSTSYNRRKDADRAWFQKKFKWIECNPLTDSS